MDYKYQILYRGQLAVKKLTLPGAKKMVRKLLKEKGWLPSDVKLVLAEPETGVTTQGSNS